MKAFETLAHERKCINLTHTSEHLDLTDIKIGVIEVYSRTGRKAFTQCVFTLPFKQESN